MRLAVLFDCDSTLSDVEGIDALARRAGVYDEVAPLTRAAMEGALPLAEVYRQRMELIRPHREDLDWLGTHYVERCVTGAEETVARLTDSGHNVHIVSGGLLPAVRHLALHLGVPEPRVHAVDVYFDAAGGYAGFDAACPLARNRGKAEICRRVLEVAGAAVLVGDGITDLEAAESGVKVIGFGGVVRRPHVVAGAWVFVDGPSLTAVLDVVSMLESAA